MQSKAFRGRIYETAAAGKWITADRAPDPSRRGEDPPDTAGLADLHYLRSHKMRVSIARRSARAAYRASLEVGVEANGGQSQRQNILGD